MRKTFFRRYLLPAVADICPRDDPARRRAAAAIRWEAHRLCNRRLPKISRAALERTKPYAGDTGAKRQS